MAAFSQEIERNVNLAIGSKTVGPVSIDDDVRTISITIDHSNWTDPSARLSAFIECSVSDGEFRPVGGVNATGSATNPRGNLTMVEIALPPGKSRTVRASYTVSGARFRTTITVIGKV